MVSRMLQVFRVIVLERLNGGNSISIVAVGQYTALRVWLVGPSKGLEGFVRCAVKEPKTSNVRCVVLPKPGFMVTKKLWKKIRSWTRWSAGE